MKNSEAISSDSQGNSRERQGPSDETLRHFVNSQWSDLHHSRVQEWSALGIVTGAHVALIEVLRFLQSGNEHEMSMALLSLGAFSLGLLFAIVGALVTLRHRDLMKVKLAWIFSAEEQLGLVLSSSNPSGIVPKASKMTSPTAIEGRVSRGLALPRKFSTSWLILAVYLLFAILDIVLMVIFL